MSTMAIEATVIAARDADPRLQGRLRAGAVALIRAGIAGALVPLGTSGVPTDPAQNVAFALGANSLGWRRAMTLALIHQALLVLGSLALYVRLTQTGAERWAFAGLVVTVCLTMLFVPMMGFAALVVPAVGVLICKVASSQPRPAKAPVCRAGPCVSIVSAQRCMIGLR